MVTIRLCGKKRCYNPGSRWCVETEREGEGEREGEREREGEKSVHFWVLLAL